MVLDPDAVERTLHELSLAKQQRVTPDPNKLGDGIARSGVQGQLPICRGVLFHSLWRQHGLSASPVRDGPAGSEGIADCTNGFRAIRAALYVDMPLTERGFAVIVEELYWAKRLGATVASVPTSLLARAEDQRPTLFVYRPRVIWSYLKYALRACMVVYCPRQA